MNRTALVLGIAFASVAAFVGWQIFASSTRSESVGSAAAKDPSPCPDGAAPLYWKAPMDPTFTRSEPGKSPMGMDLVPECPPRTERAPRHDSRAIGIDAATIQSMGVRTARAERRDLARSVRASGRVSYDERRLSHVHTKVQGWIEQLHVTYAGQVVRHGEPVLEIYSPELLATQEDLLAAARYRDATAESPIEDVRAAGGALFDAARRRLQLWDVSERDIEQLLATGEPRKTLALRAHDGGVVTQIMAREGMEVSANESLYSIADLSHVWIVAEVYEFELPWLAEGQRARVEVRSVPGRVFEGVVAQILPFLDAETRTAHVRIELANPGLLLMPDMFASVVLEAEPRSGAIAIPGEAVIRSGERTIAIRAIGDGRFEPVDVELGVEDDQGNVEVLRGIDEGELVVVSGQFLIDSESRLREAIERLRGGASVDSESGEVWTCPMHPHVAEHGPGKCPICGMQLVPRGGEE